MLTKRDIIIFGEDWGRFPSTTQHIGKIFLQSNRILWIGSLAHRKPTFSLADLKRIIEKLRNIFLRRDVKSDALPENLYVLHPFIIPLHDFGIVRSINAYLLRKAVKKAMVRIGFVKPVVITSSPIPAGVIGKLGESSSTYLCLDDYAHFDGAFDSILEIEKSLLKRISNVFAVSDTLVKSRVPASGRSYFLPQGVNSGHFKKTDDVAERVKNIPHPIIGFFGFIASWIDVKLFVYLAENNPEKQIVLIGKTDQDISVFQRYKNIHYLGEIPFSELPSYASCFDVGTIPFLLNELTLVCNPLKLVEYFSLGIPVVSTPLPEVVKFGNAVFIASSHEEFNKAINEAILNDTKEKKQERIQIAQKYSWEGISESISTKIEEFENIKQGKK